MILPDGFSIIKSKANVVVDVLSKKSLPSISLTYLTLLLELININVCFNPD